MSVATPGLESRSLRPAKRRPVKISTILSYTLLSILSVVFLTPFYLIFRNALLTQPQILSFDWVWLPIPTRISNAAAPSQDVSQTNLPQSNRH